MPRSALISLGTHVNVYILTSTLTQSPLHIGSASSEIKVHTHTCLPLWYMAPFAAEAISSDARVDARVAKGLMDGGMWRGVVNRMKFVGKGVGRGKERAGIVA